MRSEGVKEGTRELGEGWEGGSVDGRRERWREGWMDGWREGEMERGG